MLQRCGGIGQIIRVIGVIRLIRGRPFPTDSADNTDYADRCTDLFTPSEDLHRLLESDRS